MLFTCTGFPLVPQTYRLIPILRSLQELSSLSGKPFTQPFSARLDPFTITIGPKVPSPDRTSAVLYLLSLDTLFYFFFYHYLKLSCLPVSQACPTESIISSKEALFHYYIPMNLSTKQINLIRGFCSVYYIIYSRSTFHFN